MAIFQSSLLCDCSTTENLKAWITFISQSLDSAGLAKATDTGQIDLATITAPGGVTTFSAGYEIREFSDSLQTTDPIVFKIVYHSTSNRPELQITVGTGSDGTGTITGNQYFTENIFSGTNNTIPDSSLSCISADTNRVCIAMFTGLTSACFFFSLERSKNPATGVDTNEAALICHTESSDHWSQYLPLSGEVPQTQTEWAILVSHDQPSRKGIEVPTYPNWFFDYGFIKPFGINFLGYFNEDVGDYGEAPVEIYGNTHNYLFLPDVSYLKNISRDGNLSVAATILWE